MKRFMSLRKSKNTAKQLLAAFVTLCCVSIGVSIGTAKPPQQQQRYFVEKNNLHPDVVSGAAKYVSPVDSTKTINLAVVLPLRNQAELTTLLQNLYDPANPQYHQWLSVADFTERFAPTVDDYTAAVHYMQEYGLKVTGTPQNRMVLDLAGAAKDVEQAFNVKLNVYKRNDGSTIFAADTLPSAGVPLYYVRGLSTFEIVHYLHFADKNQAVHTFTTGSGPGGTFLGSDIRAAYYGGSSLTGAGQSIGLYGLNFNISDVEAYYSSIGQSFNPSVVQTISINGYDTSCGSGCDDGEPAIDIFESLSMAPGVNAVIEYEASNDVDTFNTMATDNVAKQLSASIGFLPADPSSDEPIFQEFAAQGQNLFVASDDSGAYNSSNPVFYPADDPFVTAAGGTDLNTNGAGGSWQSESAWVGSGGGISTNGFAIPSYQQLPGVINGSNQGSTSLRNVPDVAAEANTDNYYCANGSCSEGVGGTSLAAPRWAGFLALVNEQAANNGKPSVGFLNPTIYAIGTSSSYDSNFHDITTGNNGDGSGQSYNAVTGYDLATGWGSPNGQTLINTLAGGGTSNGPTPTPTACSPTSITPYIQVNGAAWQQTSTATVSAGASVNLGPQPVTGGSWSWTGPNGYTSTSRQIAITVNTTSTYVATYTNPGGCKSTQSFTLTVTGSPTPTPTPTPTGCTPTAITPYVQVNGGAWQQTSTATVSAGASVNLGPQPLNGTWSWTGPNGYTSTSRQIAITVNTTSTYVATYTNSSGCKSTQSFTLTVTGSPTPTPTPTAKPTPTATPTPGGGGSSCATAWAVGVTYSVGQEVSYAGNNYTCIQAHTSEAGWDPPAVPALWNLVGACN